MTLLKPAVGRAIGWAALGSLVVLALFGLWGAPPDAVQGDAQRLMYLHVPAAWVAYLAFGVTAIASALWLWPRTRSMVWDRIAGRFGRARCRLHRADARPRIAVGTAGVGCVVGVGRPSRHDRGPAVPLSRLSRPSTRPGCARGAGEAMCHRSA